MYFFNKIMSYVNLIDLILIDRILKLYHYDIAKYGLIFLHAINKNIKVFSIWQLKIN
jgi:Na+-transporting NADH:ubiquinone oxidoreductase subunit NqrD